MLPLHQRHMLVPIPIIVGWFVLWNVVVPFVVQELPSSLALLLVAEELHPLHPRSFAGPVLPPFRVLHHLVSPVLRFSLAKLGLSVVQRHS